MQPDDFIDGAELFRLFPVRARYSKPMCCARRMLAAFGGVRSIAMCGSVYPQCRLESCRCRDIRADHIAEVADEIAGLSGRETMRHLRPIRRGGELRWMSARRRWGRHAPAMSSTAACRQNGDARRPSGTGRSATVDSDGHDRPLLTKRRSALRSRAYRRCRSRGH